MVRRIKKTPGSSLNAAAEFWAWVVLNQARLFEDLRTLGTKGARTELVVGELGSRLKKISPALAHEIGLASPDQIEVIISADGDRRAFPLVIQTAKSAPAVSWLKATPFRQRNPEVAIEVFGQKVGPDNMAYVSRREGGKLGLDVYIEAELTPDQLAMAGFVMLDQTLGEYDVEMALGSIQFHKGRPANARPLSELPAEIDRRRPKKLN